MLRVDPDRHAGRRGAFVQRPHRRVIQRLALDVGEDQNAAQTKLGVESLELLHHDLVDDRNHPDADEALGMARRELGDAVIRDAGEPVDITAYRAPVSSQAAWTISTLRWSRSEEMAMTASSSACVDPGSVGRSSGGIQPVWGTTPFRFSGGG